MAAERTYDYDIVPDVEVILTPENDYILSKNSLKYTNYAFSYKYLYHRLEYYVKITKCLSWLSKSFLRD